MVAGAFRGRGKRRWRSASPAGGTKGCPANLDQLLGLAVREASLCLLFCWMDSSKPGPLEALLVRPSRAPTYKLRATDLRKLAT